MSEIIKITTSQDIYYNLDTPNPYDRKVDKLFDRNTIKAILSTNKNFTKSHPDFKDGNSLLWQTINQEIRREIAELQKSSKIPEGDKRYIGDSRLIGQTWYRDTMSLLLTLENIEIGIKMREIQKISATKEKKPELPKFP